MLALAVGAGLLPLRRRFPRAVLLVLAALTGLSVGVGPDRRRPPTVAAPYRAGASARPAARAAGALVTGSAVAVAPWFGPEPVPYAVALGLVLASTAVVVPGLVGRRTVGRGACCGRCASAVTRRSRPVGSPTARPASTSGRASPPRCTTWWVTASA
ncbi:hypothetical protein O1L55_17975 [Streptomyces albulus]|nr:hypothetical protein [Streptomyces noursei]